VKYSGYLFSFLLCITCTIPLYGANAPSNVQPQSTDGLGSFFTEFARAGAIVGVMKMLEKSGYPKTGCGLGVYVALSELEQKNSKFFNRTVNIVRSPWVFVRKRCELLFCGGESLSWNELITWSNRVMKLLSPLTKQTTVVDLSREKRLRLIDQSDIESILDVQWLEYSQHIEKQFSFMVKRIDSHLSYYQDKKNEKPYRNRVIDPIKNVVTYAGKACIRVSIKRDEEIAFYLEEVKTYLEEIITYTKSIKQLSDLDKDRVKRVMNSTCDAFEHIATLVDADTAASGRNSVGQLTMKRELTGNPYGGAGAF
jgi:hypothetical protein